jgi:hypothetical protein
MAAMNPPKICLRFGSDTKMKRGDCLHVVPIQEVAFIYQGQGVSGGGLYVETLNRDKLYVTSRQIEVIEDRT